MQADTRDTADTRAMPRVPRLCAQPTRRTQQVAALAGAQTFDVRAAFGSGRAGRFSIIISVSAPLLAETLTTCEA